MRSAPLIITAGVRKDLAALRWKAAAAPVDITTLRAVMAIGDGRMRHIARMQSQTVAIPGPFAFFVTLSIETGHPIGPCRHMSMSAERDGRVPSPDAVWLIAQELGFTGALESCDAVYKEKLSRGGIAVHLVQALRPDESPTKH